jgi:GH25 family lysozyme M1 (1,4-beta-N-acetylmuramidase)
MAYAVGEDRSSFQAVRPWPGNAFGFAKASEGVTWTDPTFAANWANLGREVQVRGSYHFFHPALDPVRQASFYVATVEARGGFGDGDVFLADAEILVGDDGAERRGAAAPSVRMSLPLLRAPATVPAVGERALAFLQEVARLVGPGCPVGIYTDLSMVRSAVGACSAYPLFIAYYEGRPPADVAPWRDWTFWQHEAGGGAGGGDSDYFNGDTAALLAWRDSYNWTEKLVANLPTLQMGSKDEAGQAFTVRRAPVLTAGVGRWNSLGSVTAITDDGAFGAGTKAAVEAVQRHFGLAQDGVVGPATWRALIG